MKRVAFFHGLESQPVNSKSAYLHQVYEHAYTPAIDYRDPNSFAAVLAEVQQQNIELLIGSSIGGWYAYCISTLTGIPTLLFNPAVHSRSGEPAVSLGDIRTSHHVVLGTEDTVIDAAKTQVWFAEQGITDVTFYLEQYGHRTPLTTFQQYLALEEGTPLITV